MSLGSILSSKMLGFENISDAFFQIKSLPLGNVLISAVRLDRVAGNS